MCYCTMEEGESGYEEEVVVAQNEAASVEKMQETKVYMLGS